LAADAIALVQQPWSGNPKRLSCSQSTGDVDRKTMPLRGLTGEMPTKQSMSRELAELPKLSQAIPCLAALVVLCLISLPASANIGTAFMVFGMLYLMFANILIGLFEGTLVKLLFRDLKAYVILPLFIAANYASMFVGLSMITAVRERFVSCIDAQSLLFEAPRIML
jgi:hypothetical protein